MIQLRQIKGYEGLYAVNRAGRIWAYPKCSRRKGRWLKSYITIYGYAYVVLCKNGKVRAKSVHRIVATTWLPPSRKPQVNHKNGIKTCNRASNLEWCTAKENKQHAWRTGLTRLHPGTAAVLAANRSKLIRGPHGRYLKCPTK